MRALNQISSFERAVAGGVSHDAKYRFLRQATVAVTQNCYIKTVDSDAAAARQQFERSLEYAPSMNLSGGDRPQVM